MSSALVTDLLDGFDKLAGGAHPGFRPVYAKGLMYCGTFSPSALVSPLVLISGCGSVKGWYSGTAIDSQAALAFSKLAEVRSMNEVLPLDHVGEAYDRMMSGKARFRVVLDIGQ